MDSKPDELTPGRMPESDNNTPSRETLTAGEDGRSKEWQDRARVNLEEVPEGTKTILERDFEPEQLKDDQSRDEDKSPAY